jgi:hypothetical protein
MVAGIFFMAVGLLHQLNVPSSVTTARWEFVHVLASAMCYFGLLGIMGLYARQVKESGWLGLAGFILLSLWLVLTLPFTFAEVFILPPLASTAPAVVEGFLAALDGSASEIAFGGLSTLWPLSGLSLISGGLLFGLATFRAGVLSRWAGGLLALASVATLGASVLPEQYMPLVAVPVGFAWAWLGYALWADRRVEASEPVLAERRIESLDREPG